MTRPPTVAQPAASAVAETGAEMRGALDGPGQMPAGVLDLLGPLGHRVLVATPYPNALIHRLVEAGHEVVVQLRGIGDAEAAASRLPSSVAIRCGSLQGCTETFDAVLALGGLGYLATGDAPLDSAADAIDLLETLVAPDGLLAVSIRNGFGIDRLTTMDSNRRADAFVTDQARVSHRLTRAGFAIDAVFGAYPDAIAPGVLVHADAYAACGDVVAALIGNAYPVDHGALTDPRRLALDSVVFGLGATVAPGTLIIARRSSAVEVPVSVLVAAIRHDAFRTVPHLLTSADGGGWTRTRLSGGPEEEQHDGVARDARLLDGALANASVIEEQLLAAAGAHDMAAARELLARYASWLDMPGDCAPELVFAMLDNTLHSGDDLRLLDPTWRLEAPVPAEVVYVAALHRFADRLLGSALPHPWVSAQSSARLATRLASMTGLVVTEPVLDAALRHAATAEAVLSGRHLSDVAVDVTAASPPKPDHAVVAKVGPVEPVGPAATPRGALEANRTIEAISTELANAHEQLALLTDSLADRDRRLIKAQKDVARVKASRVYQWAMILAKPLRRLRRRLIGKSSAKKK